MCMMLYIGSDNKLPLIEYKENESKIWVRNLDCTNDNFAVRDDNFARKNLKKKHKYYIGSWQHCGCGFAFDKEIGVSNRAVNEYNKQSVEALFEYIRTNIKDTHCELLSFWSYGEINEPDGVINLKSFALNDSFKFLDGQHITVYIE